MLSLALALVASTSIGSPTSPPAVARFTDDPPIHVSLSSNNAFIRGQRARVYIQAAEDGYVVVLRADAQGRVRVLYPLDPRTDAVTPGGRKFEVRSGGDREAFTVDDAEGTGVVLAAWSESPFNFDEFVNGDHWDLDALGAAHGDANAEQNSDGDSEAQPDARQIAPDAALVAVVQRMAAENHFDYDVASYVVQAGTAYNDNRDRRSDDAESQDGESQDRRSYDRGSYDGPDYGGPYYGPWYGPRSGLSLSLGFGSPWRYGRVGIGTYCDGFYWSSWGCGPFYDPFYYPVVYSSYWSRPHGYRSYGFGFGRSYRQPFIGHDRGYRSGTSWGYAQSRVRVPSGGSFSSGSSRGYVGGRTGTRVFGPSRTFDRGSAGPGYSRGGGGYSRSSGGYTRSSGGAARSSGGYSRSGSGGYSRSGGGGYSRSGGGGYSRSGGGGYSRGGGGGGGGYSRSGGGGGGGRGNGGGGGGGRRH